MSKSDSLATVPVPEVIEYDLMVEAERVVDEQEQLREERLEALITGYRLVMGDSGDRRLDHSGRFAGRIGRQVASYLLLNLTDLAEAVELNPASRADDFDVFSFLTSKYIGPEVTDNLSIPSKELDLFVHTYFSDYLHAVLVALEQSDEPKTGSRPNDINKLWNLIKSSSSDATWSPFTLLEPDENGMIKFERIFDILKPSSLKIESLRIKSPETGDLYVSFKSAKRGVLLKSRTTAGELPNLTESPDHQACEIYIMELARQFRDPEGDDEVRAVIEAEMIANEAIVVPEIPDFTRFKKLCKLLNLYLMFLSLRGQLDGDVVKIFINETNSHFENFQRFSKRKNIKKMLAPIKSSLFFGFKLLTSITMNLSKHKDGKVNIKTVQFFYERLEYADSVRRRGMDLLEIAVDKAERRRVKIDLKFAELAFRDLEKVATKLNAALYANFDVERLTEGQRALASVGSSAEDRVRELEAERALILETVADLNGDPEGEALARQIYALLQPGDE